VPFETVQALLVQVATAILPPPVSALELLQRYAGASSYLRTMLPPLDAALMGGLPPGSITEVVGPAGLGKTQFCLGMCLMACMHHLANGGGRVLYIDTERKFSGERLAEMARSRFPESFGGVGAVSHMLERVLVKVPESSATLLQMLQTLQSAIIDHGIKLLIIDSIAALARSDFGPRDMADRQRLLGRQASSLKFLAESFRIPVLVTNQVTTAVTAPQGATDRSTSGGLKAALGPMWAHAVNTRLIMAAQQDPNTNQQVRTITIAKSPSAPNLSVVYNVTAGGLEWVQHAQPPRVQPGSVVDMLISNYQAYEAEGEGGENVAWHAH
jgi:RAD51-like protein 1